MFTGLVKAVGQLQRRQHVSGDQRFTITTPELATQLSLGDSIAVAGVCLTVTECLADGFCADVSRETLACTRLDGLREGDPVNLEPSLRVGDELGGHWVTGHVDGLAELIAAWADARSTRMRFSVSAALAPFIAAKGSVALDGVSLTVNTVQDRSFEVNLIPHTLEHTTFGELAVGDPVNLEVDLMARYLARMTETAQPGRGADED